MRMGIDLRRGAPIGIAGLCLVTATVTAGCTPGPHTAALPPSPTPCASRTAIPTPRPTPTATKLTWRAEEQADGSVTMTIGDVDAAPHAGDTVRTASYAAPSDPNECDTVRITRVDGWWCTTTVTPVSESGAIVVGGAAPEARLSDGGFATHCSGRSGRFRQVYRFQRDAWDGWRDYSATYTTPWTSGQDQSGARIDVPCPQGRTGTYDYRLTVQVEVTGVTVGDSQAASARIRQDCGTGVS